MAQQNAIKLDAVTLTKFNQSTAIPVKSRGRNSLVIRILDIVIAVSALIFFLPLMVLIALLITLEDGGGPIFRQSRIGYGGRLFSCFKFRSMSLDADAQLARLLAESPEARAEWARDQKLRSDPRITKLGQFIRKSSLDELPQIFNVLRGDMSIVGPRPIVPAEISRYGRWFESYCSVHPGVTGLWQVSGRNNTTYQRRVAMDHVFARGKSPGLYLWILVMTVPAVLLKKGSY